MAPLHRLKLILTAACNLRCGYCYQNEKQNRRIEWAVVKAALDRLLSSTRSEVEVLFIGGEPLLEFPTIVRALDYLESSRRADMSIRYAIITNGMLLGSEEADFLARHRFATQVSFDGVPSAQRLRGEHTFPVLDALLDRLRAQYPEFYDRDLNVNLVLTPETISSLAESIVYFVRTKRLRNITISPVTTPATDWRPERIDELDRAIESIFDISLQHFERTGEVPVHMFRRSGGPPATHAERVPMCRIGGDELDEIAVDVDGQAHGCLMFAGSYQVFPTAFLRSRVEAMRLGDIRGLNFDRRVNEFPDAARSTAIFHDKQLKYSSYRRCADCEYLAECIVCPMSIGRHEGEDDPHRVPDFNCAFSLVSLKYRARFPRVLTFAEMLAGPSQRLSF